MDVSTLLQENNKWISGSKQMYQNDHELNRKLKSNTLKYEIQLRILNNSINVLNK